MQINNTVLWLKSLIGSVVLLVVSAPIFAMTQSIPIVNSQFVVGARKYMTWTIPVTMQGARITGTFQAAGGNNDIEVVVFDTNGMAIFSRGNAAFTYYNSGRVSFGTINVNLPPGTYYLVFSNSFSLITSKTVMANIALSVDY